MSAINNNIVEWERSGERYEGERLIIYGRYAGKLKGYRCFPRDIKAGRLRIHVWVYVPSSAKPKDDRQ